MKDRDYLWCLLHLIADQEEELEGMCPQCRARAEEAHCAACGRPASQLGEGAANPAFDGLRFQRMKEGGQP